jgi:hypothetical protein
MSEAQIVAFHNHLAVDRKVAAATQNQALNALVFLYRLVLGREELALDDITRAKRPERLPTVFDRSEIERLFAHIEGTAKLVSALLYGAGLCVCSKGCACAYRISNSSAARSSFATAREPRTASAFSLRHSFNRSATRWLSRSNCTPKTWPQGLARSTSRTPWSASIPARRNNGVGNTCFRPETPPSIRAQARSGVTTLESRRSSARLRGPSLSPASTSTAVVTPCGIIPHAGLCRIPV